MNEQDFISRISELLARCPHVELGSGATSRDIMLAEMQLRVTFPRLVRAYLEYFGYLSFGGEELYGLGSDVPKGLNLVEETHFVVRMDGNSLPHGLVPLRMSDDGEISYIDTTRASGGDCPVVSDIHATSGFEDVAGSFSDWLVGTVIGSSPE